MSTFVDIMNELREKEKKIVLMDGFQPATRAFKCKGFTSVLCELLKCLGKVKQGIYKCAHSKV